MTDAARKVAGTYLNIARGFTDAFVDLGWASLAVHENTHHGGYGVMVYWPEDAGIPQYPRGWQSRKETEVRIAKTAQITGDMPGERFVTLGADDGTFSRWQISEETMKSIWRDINDRL